MSNQNNSTKPHSFVTNAIHAGHHPDTSAVPIYQGINAPRPDGETGYITAIGGEGGPTVAALETAVSQLEAANWTVATSTGMAAIYLTLFSLLQKGDRIVAHRCVYTYATRLLNEDLAPKWGIEIEWVDMRDLEQLRTALQKPTRLVYFEPVANPAMHLLDVANIVQMARAAGAITAVDNTLLSPYLLRPLTLGVDLVLHSATKYLGGHGDAQAGLISGLDSLLHESVGRMRAFVGSFLAPLNAYLVLRGIRTLPLRMEQHCANTQAVVAFLQTRPEISSIRFPGLETSYEPRPAAYGALLGFTLAEGLDPEALQRGLKLCRPWGSLGDVETLVSVPAASAERDVPPNYVRVAVGLESPQDIIEDLAQALAALG